MTRLVLNCVTHKKWHDSSLIVCRCRARRICLDVCEMVWLSHVTHIESCHTHWVMSHTLSHVTHMSRSVPCHIYELDWVLLQINESCHTNWVMSHKLSHVTHMSRSVPCHIYEFDWVLLQINESCHVLASMSARWNDWVMSHIWVCVCFVMLMNLTESCCK